MWWLVAVVLIAVSVVAFGQGLITEGIEAPQPTAWSNACFYGALATGAAGIGIMVWRVVSAIAGIE